MRPAARAPVVHDGDHQQQIGDEGRRDGDRTGGGPSGPGGARKVRNQRATAASSIEMLASSISRLCISGRRTLAMASATRPRRTGCR